MSLHTTQQMVGGRKDNLGSFFCLLSPPQPYKPCRVAYKVHMHTLLTQLTTCLDLMVGETLWSTASASVSGFVIGKHQTAAGSSAEILGFTLMQFP